MVLGKMRKLGLLLRPRKVSGLEKLHQFGSDGFCNLIISDELNNQSEVAMSANEKGSDLEIRLPIWKSKLTTTNTGGYLFSL